MIERLRRFLPKTERQRRIAEAYLFVLPWLVGFVFLLLVPFITTFWQSFHQEVQLDQSVGWQAVGVKNWADAVSNDLTLRRFIIPQYLRFLCIVFPLIQVFALFCAIMLNGRFPGRGFFRAIFFLPVLIYSSSMYRVFNSNGAFSYPLYQVTLPNIVGRLLSFDVNVGNIIGTIMGVLTDIMVTSGIQILVFLAALQSVPRSLYESAYVDGCTEWEAFWKITLPVISPFVLLNVIYTLIESFTAAWNTLPEYILDLIVRGRLLNNLDMGYGSAVAMLFTTFILLLVLAGLGLARKRVFYSGERY